MRTITQILIDADNTQDINELQTLWEEIRSNLEHYPLIQLKFSIEHMQEIAVKLAKNDAIALKTMIDALNEID